MSLVSFVIPCYRSENTITAVVDELRRTMPTLPQYDYELILVNDCSPDGTFSVISQLAENDERITAVDLAKNFGQHAALMAGFHHCAGDIIVCLDDDGQTPADEVGKLLEKLEEGYDVVYASYETKQHSSFRNWGTRLNNKMTEIMLGKPKELSIPSYLAARRFIIEEMLSYTHCYPYVDGLILRTTRNICNVPVNHRAREEGESGYTLAKLIGLWMNGFTSFSVKPLRLASYFGAFTALVGFIYAIIIVIKKFIDSTVPVGWSSTMALQLVLGGIILLVLGITGEYIGRIYMCINNAPQFVERRVVKKDKAENGKD
ncbi:MAG: glycosyltransferase family 2 protein [Clostridia bacterium]|nr:glycosyltransferase family 2 protein [Clostridia bacterium]